MEENDGRVVARRRMIPVLFVATAVGTLLWDYGWLAALWSAGGFGAADMASSTGPTHVLTAYIFGFAFIMWGPDLLLRSMLYTVPAIGISVLTAAACRPELYWGGPDSVAVVLTLRLAALILVPLVLGWLVKQGIRQHFLPDAPTPPTASST